MNSHLYYNDDFIFGQNWKKWHALPKTVPQNKSRKKNSEWKSIETSTTVPQNTQIFTRIEAPSICIYASSSHCTLLLQTLSERISWDRTRPKSRPKRIPARARDTDQRVIFKIRSFMDADPLTQERSLSPNMHFLAAATTTAR